jgi:hypothetical protein
MPKARYARKRGTPAKSKSVSLPNMAKKLSRMGKKVKKVRARLGRRGGSGGEREGVGRAAWGVWGRIGGEGAEREWGEREKSVGGVCRAK